MFPFIDYPTADDRVNILYILYLQKICTMNRLSKHFQGEENYRILSCWSAMIEYEHSIEYLH